MITRAEQREPTKHTNKNKIHSHTATECQSGKHTVHSHHISNDVSLFYSSWLLFFLRLVFPRNSKNVCRARLCLHLCVCYRNEREEQRIFLIFMTDKNLYQRRRVLIINWVTITEEKRLYRIHTEYVRCGVEGYDRRQLRSNDEVKVNSKNEEKREEFSNNWKINGIKHSIDNCTWFIYRMTRRFSIYFPTIVIKTILIPSSFIYLLICRPNSALTSLHTWYRA